MKRTREHLWYSCSQSHDITGSVLQAWCHAMITSSMLAWEGHTCTAFRSKESAFRTLRSGLYLVLGGEGALGTLGFAAQLLQGAIVLADVHLVLLLDQLDEVVHHAVVKVLSTQVSVTAG